MLIVLNPAAGRGSAHRCWPKIRAALDSRRMPYEWASTVGAGHAFELAKEAAARGVPTVVAVGGDGTISEVANGLLGSSSSLGIIPIGTGNDFARHIGLSGDISYAVDVLQKLQVRTIDIGHWQVGRNSGHFLNIAGTGFDAVTAERINKGFRTLRGRAAYIGAVLATLATYRPTEVSIQVDEMRFEGTAMLCAIANASSYGGGMRIAPKADLFDGLFEVVLVGGVGKFEFLKTFPRVFRGTHLSHPAVKVWQGRRVRIEADPALPVLSDGELTGLTPAVFEIVPKALNVVLP